MKKIAVGILLVVFLFEMPLLVYAEGPSNAGGDNDVMGYIVLAGEIVGKDESERQKPGDKEQDTTNCSSTPSTGDTSNLLLIILLLISGIFSIRLSWKSTMKPKEKGGKTDG